MTSFKIPEGPNQIEAAAPGAASKPATFSVTNISRDSMRGRLSVKPGEGAKAEWFNVDGERERSFTAGGSETVNVTATVPAGTAPGQYRFALRVVAVNDPDNDTAESPSVTLAVGAAPPPKKSNTWIIILVAVLLLVAAAVAAYFLLKPKAPVAATLTVTNTSDDVPPPPPPVQTQIVMPDLLKAGAAIDEQEARRQLSALNIGLTIETRPVADTPTTPPDTVVQQNPAAGEPLAKQGIVRLGVSTPWFFGTWSGTIDGRPARMRWWSDANHAIIGDFSDNGSAFVPLTHDSHTGDKLYFTHKDGNHWYLGRQSDGHSSGYTTWQSHQYPLKMDRTSETVFRFYPLRPILRLPLSNLAAGLGK